MSRRFIRHAIGSLAATAAIASGLAFAGSAASEPPDDVQAVKAASARYHSVERALADGYVRGHDCIQSPAGAMGIHFENPELIEDPQMDVRRPEILLYLPKANGGLELVGVEYMVNADDVATRPQLFGQPFQGPMPAHHPEMETHYDLHAWVWAENPRGMFAQFNPALTCTWLP